MSSTETIEKDLVDDFSLICEIRENKKKNKKLKHYYRIFTERDFLSSCWKHIIDFKQEIKNSVAREKLTQDVGAFPEKVERYLKEALNLQEHEVMVGIALVDPFKPSATNDITLEYNDTAKSLSELGLHVRREFAISVPYVYLPSNKVKEGMSLLQSYSTALLR